MTLHLRTTFVSVLFYTIAGRIANAISNDKRHPAAAIAKIGRFSGKCCILSKLLIFKLVQNDDFGGRAGRCCDMICASKFREVM
jgi:hypothetical protein